jgi:hypothetical protein
MNQFFLIITTDYYGPIFFKSAGTGYVMRCTALLYDEPDQYLQIERL